MRQLTGQDAVFLYMESRGAPLHVSALSVYDPSTAPDGAVRYKDILKHIESRLDTSPVFRQKLVQLPLSLDFPYWVDDENFDLEFHVRHIGLPAPRDWRQLCILVARLHSHPLDMTRPPWEMYVIEGLDHIPWLPRGSYAILSKYHHAAVDGATGAEITSGMHDLLPNPPKDAKQLPWLPEAEPSLFNLLARASVNNLKTPFRLMRALSATTPALGRRLLRSGKVESSPKNRVPHTRFNKQVSPHRVFEGQVFALDDLRAIRKQVAGATINDVVLAICSGALRSYLDEKGELPDEPLVAMAPINTRVSGEQGDTGNTISAMFVNLHTDIAGPLELLQSIHKTTRQSKEMDRAISARQMTDINKHIPATTLALAGRLITGLGLGYRAIRWCNCVITNVPGPQAPLYMNGAKMVQIMASAPIVDGVGLMIAAFSYNGTITISFSSCRDLMPDPQVFSNCLRQSFTSLRDATLRRPKRATRLKHKAKASKKAGRKKSRKLS